MEEYVWVFMGTTVAGVLALIGVVVSHRSQKGTPEHRMIDQQQEDIAALREDLTKMKTEHTAEMQALKTERAAETKEVRRRMSAIEDRDRVYIPHILRLNRHIELGIGPPAPDIPVVIDTYLREEAEKSAAV